MHPQEYCARRLACLEVGLTNLYRDLHKEEQQDDADVQKLYRRY